MRPDLFICAGPGILVMMLLMAAAEGGLSGRERQEQDEGLRAKILSLPGFAPGVEGARFFINGGIGLELPVASYMQHDLPPIPASVDFVFPGTGVSLGGKFAFSTVRYGGRAVEGCANFDIGLRMAIHTKIFGQVKNPAVFALAITGFDFATGDAYQSLKDSTYATTNFDGFYTGLGLGARYFFTRNTGVFLEADVKMIMKFAVGASAGLALKF